MMFVGEKLMLMSTHEVARLQAVSSTYHEDQKFQIKWSNTNPGNQAILLERMQLLERILRAAGYLPLAQQQILEVGCGTGQELDRFTQWGALPDNLYGVDLLPDRIEKAKQRFPELRFQTCNAEQLNFETAAFDLILLFTVLTSILDQEMAHNVATEVRRVLKPNGAAIWYDFRYNNPHNPNVRGLSKQAIQELFPDFDLNLQTVTLLPPLARRLGRMTSVLYSLLASVPILRTHYLGLLTKPDLNEPINR
jgi:SAM-dependent methyltransferase